MGIGSAIKSMFGVQKGSGLAGSTQTLASGEMNPQERAFYDYLVKTLTDPNQQSLAQAQLKQGQQDILKQAAAMQSSNRSINPALASRNIQQAQTESMADLNQQMGIQRAQEQQQVQSQLGNLLAQIRGSQTQASLAETGAETQRQKSKGELFKQIISSAGQAMAGTSQGGK